MFPTSEILSTRADCSAIVRATASCVTSLREHLEKTRKLRFLDENALAERATRYCWKKYEESSAVQLPKIWRSNAQDIAFNLIKTAYTMPVNEGIVRLHISSQQQRAFTAKKENLFVDLTAEETTIKTEVKQEVVNLISDDKQPVPQRKRKAEVLSVNGTHATKKSRPQPRPHLPRYQGTHLPRDQRPHASQD